MRNVKLFLVLALLGCLVVFSIQNAARVEVQFLIWSFSLRRAFLLFAVFAIGLITGWLLHAAGRHRGGPDARHDRSGRPDH